MSSTYLICLDEPDSAVLAAVEKLWKNSCHAITDTHILVAPPSSNGEVIVSKSVYEKIKAETESPFRCVVFQVGSYYGFHDREVWEWLGQAKVE